MTSQGQRDEAKDHDGLNELLREKSSAFREMSRLLESRRLETQEGPFRGFRSPPGRF
jgi:hypothetical protein